MAAATVALALAVAAYYLVDAVASGSSLAQDFEEMRAYGRGMTKNTNTLTLNDGVQMPPIGLGLPRLLSEVL